MDKGGCTRDRVKNIASKLAMFTRHATFPSHSNNVKVVKAYWTSDKPIYFAFKICQTIPSHE
jgi:hypothetical protein